jgi:hypothetical protein
MSTDREIAATLIDNCYRRMSGREIALCHYINQEGTLLDGDRPMFTDLQTQFASDLAYVQSFATTSPLPCRETPDEEGASFL